MVRAEQLVNAWALDQGMGSFNLGAGVCRRWRDAVKRPWELPPGFDYSLSFDLSL